MVALAIYFLAMMVGLRLVGIAAEQRGKEDWHWWFISLAVIGIGYLLAWGTELLLGFGFSISFNGKFELPVLGMIFSAAGLYVLYRLLGGKIVEEDIDTLKSKVDTIGTKDDINDQT